MTALSPKARQVSTAYQIAVNLRFAAVSGPFGTPRREKPHNQHKLLKGDLLNLFDTTAKLSAI